MLIGNKVILEEIMPENIEQMRIWRNDPQLRQYFREWKDITPSMQEKWYSERGNNSNPNHVYFQITAISIDKSSKHIIGCCSLYHIDWRLRSCEFSIYLDSKEHGGGKGKNTLELLFDYGFNKMNMHKIYAEVFINNNAFYLYKKLGFKTDGVSRDSHFHGGVFGDSYLISLLQEEWKQYTDE